MKFTIGILTAVLLSQAAFAQKIRVTNDNLSSYHVKRSCEYIPECSGGDTYVPALNLQVDVSKDGIKTSYSYLMSNGRSGCAVDGKPTCELASASTAQTDYVVKKLWEKMDRPVLSMSEAENNEYTFEKVGFDKIACYKKVVDLTIESSSTTTLREVSGKSIWAKCPEDWFGELR